MIKQLRFKKISRTVLFVIVFFITDIIPLTAQSNKNRVEIQVYRGANNEKENYAPWGFVVRQPLDDPNHNSEKSIQPSDKSDSIPNNLPDPR